MLKKYMDEREFHVNAVVNSQSILNLNANGDQKFQPFHSYTENSSTHRTCHMEFEGNAVLTSS